MLRLQRKRGVARKMRSLVGLFGAVCCVIVVVIVGRYGYMGADNEFDGYMTAFFYGAITAGGLGFHAVAIRVWRYNRTWSLIIGFVATAAVIVSLTNSLGFIAVRGDKGQAERTKIIETIAAYKAELARLIKQRQDIPQFTATSSASVEAAKEAVASAERIRAAECRRRGPRCRNREQEEQIARAKLVDITAAKAATDRAHKLETKVATIRGKLATAKPTESVDPHANALSRILLLPEDWAAKYVSTYQQLAVAVIFELLTLMSFVAYEVLGRETRTQSAPREPVEPQETALRIEPPNRPKPRLVKSDVQKAGSVPDIMSDILVPDKGQRVEIEEAYNAYLATCQTNNLRAVTPDQFIGPMERFCEACNIASQKEGEYIFLTDVTLMNAENRAKAMR